MKGRREMRGKKVWVEGYSELVSDQIVFAEMLGLLLGYGRMIGVEITMGDCYRDERCGYGHPRSLHRSRRAADLNLWKDGRFLRGEEAEKWFGRLHDFWDAIGGNERIEGDLRHFSFSMKEGVR